MVIIFSIPDMGLGGSERVLSKLANYWAVHHTISIVTIKGIEDDFYPLNPAIERICINLIPKKWYHFLKIFNVIIKLRDIYYTKKPDFIISFLPRMNILSLLSLSFSKKKLVICERNIINNINMSGRINFLRKILYKKAYKITVQHEEIYHEFLSTFPSINPDNVIITPNPIDPFVGDTKMNWAKLFNNYSTDDKILIAVGRFTDIKAHQDTIKMFFLLKKIVSKTKLVVCGNGNELDKCKNLVNELGLNDSVCLPGLITNINSYYAAADLFITTTYFEGFPNAIVEALSAGLPVIAFNAPSIPIFVKDGYNGYIIGNRNNEAMANRIQNLLADKDLYDTFSKSAKNISQEYSMEKIHKIWMEKILC